MKSILGAIIAAILSIFGGHQAVTHSAPSAAAAAASAIPSVIVAASSTSTAPVAGTTTSKTIVYQPIIERIIDQQSTSTGISESYLDARLGTLDQSLRLFASQTASAPLFSGPGAPLSVEAFAPSQRIDNLANVTISNATVSGVSGLKASDIPDLSGTYLPLSGGILTAGLVMTNATTTNFFATYASTTNATTTNLAVTGTGYFAGNVGVGTMSPSSTFSVAGPNKYSSPHQVYLMGDSLTSPSGHYGTYLAALLGVSWNVDWKGVSGNTTTQMLARFNNDVLVPGNAEYVIVWGGVNDIAQGATAATIEGNLQSMYNAAHDAGVKVVAINITPFCGDVGWSSCGATAQATQNAVNAWIANSAKNVNYTVDAYSILVDPSVPYTLLAAYDDGSHLHLTSAGYSAVATAIYNAVTWSPVLGSAVSINGDSAFLGRVAIGTTTATATLSVGGSIYTSGGITFPDGTSMSSASATLPGTTGQIPYFSGTNTAVGTSSVFLASSGNLGVGTQSPSSLLHLSSNTPILTFTAASTTVPYGIQFNANDAFIKQTADSGELQINVGRSIGWGGFVSFYTDTTEKMRMTSGGNVGIGMSTPAYKLDIYPTAGTSGNLLRVGSSTVGTAFTIKDSGNLLDSAGAIGTNGGVSGDLSAFIIGATSYAYSAQNQRGTALLAINDRTSATVTLPAGNFDATGGMFSARGNSGGGYKVEGVWSVADAGNGIGYGLRTQVTGSGSNNYGLYIDSVTSATNNYGIYVADSSAKNYFSGSVGIGTTTPWARLSIAALSSNTAPLFTISTSTASATSTAFLIDKNGLVGIGTSSPTTALQVNGVITPNADNASSLGNATYRWSAVYAANGTIQTSDQRLKSNITDLNYGLSDVLKLRPVSFTWTALPQQGTQLGFLAQEVQPIVPETVNVGDDASHTLGLTYTEFIPVIVRAIQQIAAQVGTNVSSTANAVFDTITAHNAALDYVRADNIEVGSPTKQGGITLYDKTGKPGCVTLSDADSGSRTVTKGSCASDAASASGDTSTSSPDITPPVITINGDNPAHINVGDSYADLGATVTDNVDKNLGLKYFLNGTLVSNIVIDTSAAATDTIDYVATDQAGNTATSTRSVIIEAQAPSVPVASNATTSAATSTTQ